MTASPSLDPSVGPPSQRSEGQWALGQVVPLNHNEQLKADDDGLDVRHRIETIYARTGFAGIDPDDLRGRFRWWGLYTQRKPGIDGGKTATLEPHELEDEFFMLRVRIDGGFLTTEQVRTIGMISTVYGRGTADLTDRQNIQLHWIRIEDMPAIWQALEAVGLSTTEACGDVPRVILGSPVAGIAADALIDPTPTIREISRRYIGDPVLEPPAQIQIRDHRPSDQDVVHETNDIGFVATVHPEYGIGYDLWVGGGLSTNPRLAERLGAWVAPDDVPDVWAAVISVFRDYGYRRLRAKARLKFLLADWGAEQMQNVQVSETRPELAARLVSCVKAELTSATGKPLGEEAYRISINNGVIIDRRRALPEDNCASEFYQPI